MLRIQYRNGYCRVSLHKNSQNKIFSVYVLVAKTFIPNPKNLPLVDYINNIFDDNRVEN